MLSLPTRYVYVYYEDGMRENVAFSDTLSEREAKKFRRYWELCREKKVIKVTLEHNGKVIKAFQF